MNDTIGMSRTVGYADLDLHLRLGADPSTGALLADGVFALPESAGFGVFPIEASVAEWVSGPA
jgi:hypothetical protein